MEYICFTSVLSLLLSTCIGVKMFKPSLPSGDVKRNEVASILNTHTLSGHPKNRQTMQTADLAD